MKRLLLGAALLAAACSNTVTNPSSGEFSAPVGITATSAGDRDLVFIANSAKDGLVALQLCNRPLLSDGGVDPSDTCSATENGQFVPGPIRVFPGNIEVGQHTARVAGARLLLPDGGVPDGGPNGAALAVGLDGTIRIVDARSLVDVEHSLSPSLHVPDGGMVQALRIGAMGVDIVAANRLDATLAVEAADVSVKVFVVTVAPAQLLSLTASLDASGAVQPPTIDGRCDLGGVVPTRLALAPGKKDVVYVADSAGDGVVAVPTSAIAAGGPCPTTRISAGGRTVRALALNPPWFETGTDGGVITHDAGEILLMVLEPLSTTTPGKPLDSGGVIFAHTDGGILPIPPFPASGFESDGGPVVEADGGPAEPMLPLRTSPLFPTSKVSGLVREGVFLRAVPPLPGSTCTSAPCTPLYLGTGVSASGTLNFALLAAVGSSDGSTWFIDPLNRRFINTNLYGLGASSAALTPTVSPSSNSPGNVFSISPAESTANPPLLTIDTNSTTPGVTQNGTWRVIWHSQLIGLDRRAGTLTRVDASTFKFVTPPADLATWTKDPVFRLGPGDVVAFPAWNSSDPNCKDIVTAQNARPDGFELPILAVSSDTLTLGATASGVVLSDACPSVGAVAEVRIAGTDPWLILEGNTAVARWHAGDPFTATETRSDYPYDPCARTVPGIPCYDPANPPVAAQNVAFRFTISGSDPTLPVSNFTFTMNNNQAPLAIGDPANAFGLAGGMLAYSSPRIQLLVYTVQTGANEVLQIDPTIIATSGVQAYR